MRKICKIWIELAKSNYTTIDDNYPIVSQENNISE